MGELYCGGGCGIKYQDFPADMLIQDGLWKLICPKPYDGHGSGGVLCPNCICEKLIELGLTKVLVTVDTSELIYRKTSNTGGK